MNTGTFTAGSTMPTRTISGVSVQTASVYPFLVVDTAVTATTPTVTITYTDQDGNTGNVATMILPTSPALSTAFAIAPHFASGDTGMRAVTAMTKSAGTAGVVSVYGFIPVSYGVNTLQNYTMVQPLISTLPLFPFKAADTMGFFRLGSTSATQILVSITMIPEVDF
jgi:uracil phosphoribosyltransferase